MWYEAAPVTPPKETGPDRIHLLMDPFIKKEHTHHVDWHAT
jgi:hypothetical protein